ncbi:MAG: hypothetical protein ACTHM1_11870 [Solirubrobacteraceae bacterium]
MTQIKCLIGVEVDAPSRREHIDGAVLCETEGITIEVRSVCHGFGGAEVVTMVVTWLVGVGTGVVANAVYDALDRRVRRLTVNESTVKPTREDLTAALDELSEIVARLPRQRLHDHDPSNDETDERTDL